ncbi:MAG: DNA-binding protein [[Ruminococcus] gnavus]|nr:DNA-binding protein [Mediterraneibacter gnavus]
MEKLSLSEKYMLSINKTGAYFNIGVKKMRRLAEGNLGTVAVYSGNRYLIIHTKLKEFLQNNPMI